MSEPWVWTTGHSVRRGGWVSGLNCGHDNGDPDAPGLAYDPERERWLVWDPKQPERDWVPLAQNGEGGLGG